MNCTTQRQIKVLTTGSNECSFHLEIGPLELHSSENEVLKVGPNPICLSVLIRGGKAIGKQRHRGGMPCDIPRRQEISKVSGHLWKQRGGKKRFALESQRKHNLNF